LSKLYVDELHPKTSGKYVSNPNIVFFDVRKTSGTTSATNDVPFHTVEADTAGGWGSNNIEYTIPVDGVYMFHAVLLTASNTTTAHVWFDFKVNGTTARRCYSPKSGTAALHGETEGTLIKKMTKGDKIKIYYGSGNGDVYNSSIHSHFSGVMLG
jgi:hypothetical protein